MAIAQFRHPHERELRVRNAWLVIIRSVPHLHRQRH